MCHAANSEGPLSDRMILSTMADYMQIHKYHALGTTGVALQRSASPNGAWPCPRLLSMILFLFQNSQAPKTEGAGPAGGAGGCCAGGAGKDCWRCDAMPMSASSQTRPSPHSNERHPSLQSWKRNALHNSSARLTKSGDKS